MRFQPFLQLWIYWKRLVFFPNRDAKMLALTGFHNWFKSSIHKWLQIVHDRSCDRIGKAVETDKVRSFCMWNYENNTMAIMQVCLDVIVWTLSVVTILLALLYTISSIETFNVSSYCTVRHYSLAVYWYEGTFFRLIVCLFKYIKIKYVLIE